MLKPSKGCIEFLAIEPDEGFAFECGFSLTCSPWVPYLMCAPVLGWIWVLRMPG